MLLIALAVAPGVAICLLFYSLQRLGKGSMGYLLIAFLLGAVATLPAVGVQLLSVDVRNDPWHHSIWSYLWYAFGVVALSEEGSKFLVLRGYAYPKKVFREPFDGVIYSVMIGMGFATVENIEYVRQFGLETGVSRFFLAIPAHASFAVLMGYPVGRAKFASVEKHHSLRLLLKGLGVAVLFHGSFDFFLFLQQSHEAAKYLSTGVISFGAFATFYIAVRLAMRALRQHQCLQEEEAEDNQHIKS
ncbi:MAG TPA: PrsW family glutamic-type intramembrane protease [Puia sp.]|nr:PrsW family glutamic-type intramembrane protease [Puia sp.]